MRADRVVSTGALRLVLTILCAAVVVSACGGSDDEPEPAEFVFRLRGMPASEEFRVRTTSREFIRVARLQLARPSAERDAYPNGAVRRGNGGYNAPWSWHLDRAELVSGPTTEVCDGTPSMVERDLPYWADRLGAFCPWLAYLHREQP